MQLSYGQEMAPGAVGLEADLSIVSDIKTRNNPAAVLYGHVVTQAALAAGKIEHPDAAAEITDEKLVEGVVLGHHAMEQQVDSITEPHYPALSAVNVMRKGRIWVKPEDTITKGTSTVNVRYAGTGNKGALRGAAVVSETAVLPKAKWVSDSVGGLAILELDL